MKNTNRMECDKKIFDNMAKSKIGYLISADYLMVKQGHEGRAICELKKWHLI